MCELFVIARRNFKGRKSDRKNYIHQLKTNFRHPNGQPITICQSPQIDNLKQRQTVTDETENISPKHSNCRLFNVTDQATKQLVSVNQFITKL